MLRRYQSKWCSIQILPTMLVIYKVGLFELFDLSLVLYVLTPYQEKVKRDGWIPILIRINQLRRKEKINHSLLVHCLDAQKKYENSNYKSDYKNLWIEENIRMDLWKQKRLKLERQRERVETEKGLNYRRLGIGVAIRVSCYVRVVS